jgi:hypothetical protein
MMDKKDYSQEGSTNRKTITFDETTETEPDMTFDLGGIDNVKIDTHGLSKPQVNNLENSIVHNQKLWRNLDQNVSQFAVSRKLFRSKEEKNVVDQIRVKAIQIGGNYFIKLMSIETDGLLKHVATDVHLAHMADLNRLELALNSSAQQTSVAMTQTMQFLSVNGEIARQVLGRQNADPIYLETYKKLEKELLKNYTRSLSGIMANLHRSPYAKYIDHDVENAISYNHDKIGEWVSSITK